MRGVWILFVITGLLILGCTQPTDDTVSDTGSSESGHHMINTSETMKPVTPSDSNINSDSKSLETFSCPSGYHELYIGDELTDHDLGIRLDDVTPEGAIFSILDHGSIVDSVRVDEGESYDYDRLTIYVGDITYYTSPSGDLTDLRACVRIEVSDTGSSGSCPPGYARLHIGESLTEEDVTFTVEDILSGRVIIHITGDGVDTELSVDEESTLPINIGTYRFDISVGDIVYDPSLPDRWACVKVNVEDTSGPCPSGYHELHPGEWLDAPGYDGISILLDDVSSEGAILSLYEDDELLDQISVVPGTSEEFETEELTVEVTVSDSHYSDTSPDKFACVKVNVEDTSGPCPSGYHELHPGEWLDAPGYDGISILLDDVSSEGAILSLYEDDELLDQISVVPGTSEEFETEELTVEVTVSDSHYSDTSPDKFACVKVNVEE